MPVHVKLHLKDHCIETAAQRELKRVIDQYFSFNGDLSDEMAGRIELLQEFLMKSDFLKIRSSDERFSGILESYVILRKNKDGEIEIDIVG